MVLYYVLTEKKILIPYPLSLQHFYLHGLSFIFYILIELNIHFNLYFG